MKKLLSVKVSLESFFVIESLLFIVALFIVFGYRLVHFYLIENPKISNELTMAKNLTQGRNISIFGDGLYSVDDGFVYKGKNVNNYVSYSNRLWRIIRINNDNTITMVTDDLVTSLVWGYNSNYNSSYIKEWLNINDQDNSGIFEDTLVNASEYVDETNLCTDIVVNIDDATCGNITSSKIGLLSIVDYKKAGAENSYLNRGFYEWTTNISSDNKVWYIKSDGSLSDESYKEDNYYSFGVRPVISLKSTVMLKGGIGSFDNPFQIDVDNKELSVGKYIRYSDYTWEIIGINDASIKLVMDEELIINDEYFTVANSKNDITFNPSIKNSIAYYLNNTFYNKLSDKNYIIKSDFNVGEYGLSSNYDYKNVYSKTVSAKVGLLSIGNIDLNQYNGEYTLTSSNIVAETIYVTSTNGLLVKDAIDTPKEIRPVINLDKKLNIVDGNGSKELPYKLGW
jgi:hypothetical protein